MHIQLQKMELSSKTISSLAKKIPTFYDALLHPPGLPTISPSPEPSGNPGDAGEWYTKPQDSSAEKSPLIT